MCVSLVKYCTCKTHTQYPEHESTIYCVYRSTYALLCAFVNGLYLSLLCSHCSLPPNKKMYVHLHAKYTINSHMDDSTNRCVCTCNLVQYT